MTTHRFVAETVSRWLLLTLVGVACLIWFANTVELSGRIENGAVGVGLLQTPGLLIRVLPICVLCGVSLAVSRMDLRGERQALWMLGHDAARTGLVVAAIGLFVGLIGFGLQAGSVPAMERRALGSGAEIQEGWVWIDGRLIRPQDGMAIENLTTKPRIEFLETDGAGFPEAWISLRPEMKSNGDLLDSPHRSAQLEIQGRLARVITCGLLAFWTWLPVAVGRRNGLLSVVGMGLVWSLLDVVAHGLGRSGLVTISLGAWFPVFVLMGCCTGRYWAGQRVPQSSSQM